MAKYVIDEKTLTDIAKAIRTKKGTTSLILAENFAKEIEGIDNNGAESVLSELWKTQGVSKSGNTVSLIDISPIAHNFKVSVSNGADVTKYGKNLINQRKFETKTSGGITVEYLSDEDCFLINGTYSGSGELKITSKYIYIPTQKGERYTGSVKYISGEIRKSVGGNAIVYFGRSDSIGGNGNWFSTSLDTVDTANKSNLSLQTGVAQNYFSRFWFFIYGGTVTFNNYKCKVQLELGSKATEYEPYEANEYKPDINGFVDIPYTYPSATLHSKGNITAEYIKSAVKTSDEASMSLIERRETHIDIPVGTIRIGERAFSNYITLTSINIPDTVQIIEPYALYYCEKLASILMPNNLRELKNNVFQYCSNCLTYDFSRGERIPTLGTNAFSGINANAKIIVPEESYTQWVSATNWADYRNWITSKVTVPYDEEWGGIVNLNDVWAYGEGSLYLMSSDTPFKAYYKDLVSGDVSEITSENPLFGVWDFGYQVYTDGSGEVACWFEPQSTDNKVYLGGGTWEIWIENSKGKKIYSRILEVT